MRNRAAAWLMWLGCAACGSTEAGADVVDVAITTPPSSSVSASIVLPSASRRDPVRVGSLATGIPECDAYLRKLSTMLSCMPQSEQAMMRERLAEIATMWRATAGKSSQKETAATCRMAAEALQEDMFCR